MGRVVLMGLKQDRPSRPTNVLLAGLLAIALVTTRVSVPSAALLGVLLVLMIVWRLTGLGAPVEVASIDIDLDAQVIHCAHPDVEIPFADVLEPILVEHGEGSPVWTVSLSIAQEGQRPVVYRLVTETPPVGPLRGTGIRVESEERPLPVI